MSGFDDLLNPDAVGIAGASVDGKPTDLTFKDADTLVDAEGNSFRLQGVNAPEQYHEGIVGSEYQEAGAVMTTTEVAKLANAQGFDKVVVQDQGADAYGRQVVDLQDKHGRSFRHMLASSGVMPVDTRYDETGLGFTAALGRAQRQDQFNTGNYSADAWDKAAASIAQSTQREMKYAQQFKQNQGAAGDWQVYADAREAEYAADIAARKGVSVEELDQSDWRKARDLGRAEADRLYNSSIATFDKYDRDTATGMSKSPFSTSWDTGWLGVQEGLYGAAEMAGDTVGWEALEGWGTAGVSRKRDELADQGRTITDFDFANKYGDSWSEQLSKNFQALGNNAAMSLPYMAITVGATAAAPFTGGVSLTAPAAVYSGQTWNEMEGEKSAAIAVASGVTQATLDRLGLTGIVKVGGKATKDVLNDAAVAYAKKNNVSQTVARTAVVNASRKEIAALAGDASTIAKSQIQAGTIARQTATRFGLGSASEGVTEALQETTAYVGATLGSDKVFDLDELAERAEKAAIAGAALGGGFSVPGSAIDTAAWADVAYRTAPAEQKRQSDAAKWAEDEVAEHGRVMSVAELNEETNKYIESVGSDNVVSLDERIESDKQRRKDRTHQELIAETALSTPGLWRGSVRMAIPQNIMSASRAARRLAGKLGGQLQRTYSGASFENEKHHRVSIYRNMIEMPDTAYAGLNGGRVPSTKQRREISDRVYDAIQKGDLSDPAVAKIAKQMQALSDKMYKDQKKYNPELGYISNYLARYKALDKRAINNNKNGFRDALMANGYTRGQADKLIDEIINNGEVNDLGEAFSVLEGKNIPQSHKERTLNMSEKAEFKEFMERDMFANFANAAKSAAKYTTQQDFIGDNGKKIAADLDQVQAELIRDGMDPALAAREVNRMASKIKDILDAESGNYKRAQTPAGKQLQSIQKNFMFWTMLAGLPLATISSFVELALTMKGLTSDQIFGKNGKGGLKKMGEEFASTLKLGIRDASELSPHSVKRREVAETEGKQMLRNLGFYDWDVGAATTTGATEIAPLKQKATETFFQVTLLSGWTNYTRSVRASIANDYITDKLTIIMDSDPSNPTNESQEAKEALRNLGVNVEDMITYNNALLRGNVTPEMEQQFVDHMREATYSFVNEAVALPGAANRPLIYQDPRFALFTQFQGFIATFTANHIPKLWGEYVKRGTPAMKYNAFALMATMIVLGFASQYLKDLLKYGTGENPYLEDPEYIQRGIRASGLLGTGERLLDQFAPIYESRSKNPIDWVYNQTTGEAPALSNVARAGKAAGKALEGDASEAVRNTLKLAPGFGPFSRINQGLASGLGEGDWSFKEIK